MIVFSNDAPTGDPDPTDLLADVLLDTREEAARKLRISVRNLDTLTASGAITPTRIGRRVLFAREELSRFAREGAPSRS
jgi:excisionase family DNA binding protein